MIDKKIVVIGGGTGSFTILSSLKGKVEELTAIVNMADDGGSTGVLRDELGVLPPGDVRQCLVALSSTPKMRDLFNYRFEEGTFGGHSFGNIFLTALEKTSGSFSEAVEMASTILRVKGRVIPATLDDIRLVMTWPKGEAATLHGEKNIDAEYFAGDPRLADLSLEPHPTVNQHAIAAIEGADVVIVAPGDLYTSLGPLLIIDGIGDALRQSKAKKLYVCNLVTKHGQTDGFSVEDHVAEIERFAGGAFLDTILYNTSRPFADLAEKYEQEQAYIVERATRDGDDRWVGRPLLGDIETKKTSDVLPVTRSLIRHDTKRVIEEIERLYGTK